MDYKGTGAETGTNDFPERMKRASTQISCIVAALCKSVTPQAFMAQSGDTVVSFEGGMHTTTTASSTSLLVTLAQLYAAISEEKQVMELALQVAHVNVVAASLARLSEVITRNSSSVCFFSPAVLALASSVTANNINALVATSIPRLLLNQILTRILQIIPTRRSVVKRLETVLTLDPAVREQLDILSTRATFFATVKSCLTSPCWTDGVTPQGVISSMLLYDDNLLNTASGADFQNCILNLRFRAGQVGQSFELESLEEPMLHAVRHHIACGDIELNNLPAMRKVLMRSGALLSTVWGSGGMAGAKGSPLSYLTSLSGAMQLQGNCQIETLLVLMMDISTRPEHIQVLARSIVLVLVVGRMMANQQKFKLRSLLHVLFAQVRTPPTNNIRFFFDTEDVNKLLAQLLNRIGDSFKSEFKMYTSAVKEYQAETIAEFSTLAQFITTQLSFSEVLNYCGSFRHLWYGMLFGLSKQQQSRPKQRVLCGYFITMFVNVMSMLVTERATTSIKNQLQSFVTVFLTLLPYFDPDSLSDFLGRYEEGHRHIKKKAAVEKILSELRARAHGLLS